MILNTFVQSCFVLYCWRPKQCSWFGNVPMKYAEQIVLKKVSETVFSCCGYNMRRVWGEANGRQQHVKQFLCVFMCRTPALQCLRCALLCWYLLCLMYLDDFNAHSVSPSQCDESNPVHSVSRVLFFLTCLLLKDLESSCSIRLW